MKKLLSIALVAVLMLTCSIGTFSANTAPASPDEAKQLVSIEMTELPSKTTYNLIDEAGWNIDIDENETDWEVIEEAILNAPFYINVDLSDAVITGTYSDGSTQEIDPSLCTTSVADPVKLADLVDIEDEDVLYSMICREYTINIEYLGVSTSFKVNVDYSYEPEYSEIYEFVSYTDPVKNEYVIGEDFTEEVYIDDAGNEMLVEYLNFDLTGMTVTLKNTETGELVTYGEDNIYLEFRHDVIAPALVAGRYYALGTVITDEGELVSFDYLVTLVEADDNATEESKPVDNTDDIKEESKPTSTADTAEKATTDNNTVQTGRTSFAGLFLVLMLSATAITFIVYRRKVE